MKKITFAILIAILLMACGKQTQVKGILYSDKNLPEANSTIYLVEEVDDSPNSPRSNWREITKTDGNGEYQFSFKGKKKNNYTVAGKCSSGGTAIALNDIKVDTTNSVNLFCD